MTHPVRLLSALACALLACAPDPTTPGSPDATFEPVQVWIDPAWSPGNGASVDWGPGNGLWFVGDNSNTGELAGHVTEAGCAAEVWTAAQVVELEQRRLGRWRG